jgi:ornithine--oxo-acid transaminase
VAGYHTEVIKFLPPITIGKEDLDWFLSAMQEVLADTCRIPGAAWDTVAGLAKRTMFAGKD